MKRVGCFEVELKMSKAGDNSAFASKSRRKPLHKCLRFHSWHKTCEQIDRMLKKPDEQLGPVQEAVVMDARTKSVLARFSNENLESTTETKTVSGPKIDRHAAKVNSVQGLTKKWDTITFCSESSPLLAGPHRIYENRNVRDYHWQLIEGASREIPFRLSYLERKAEKYQVFGLALHWFRWAMDCVTPFTDLFRRARVF